MLILNSDGYSPHELSLPDDNPRAMITICQILHLRNQDLSASPTVSEFEHFAFLCDKYECAVACRFVSLRWLDNLASSVEPKSCGILLNCAHLLNEGSIFDSIARRMVAEWCSPWDELPRACHGVEFLPPKVFSKFIYLVLLSLFAS
jgi:hypothetical protein